MDERFASTPNSSLLTPNHSSFPEAPHYFAQLLTAPGLPLQYFDEILQDFDKSIAKPYLLVYYIKANQGIFASYDFANSVKE